MVNWWDGSNNGSNDSSGGSDVVIVVERQMMVDSDSDDDGDAGSPDGADRYGIIHDGGCRNHDSGLCNLKEAQAQMTK